MRTTWQGYPRSHSRQESGPSVVGHLIVGLVLLLPGGISCDISNYAPPPIILYDINPESQGALNMCLVFPS